MTNHTTRRGALTALAIGAMSFALPAAAQNTGPLTIVVPYAAGGTTDAFARMIADGMARELGRTVLVTNRPGANGILGATAVANAAPDGNTLLMGLTGPVSLNAMLRPSLPYQIESFAPVAMLFDGGLTITVPTALGVNSIEELAEHARTTGRPIRYGTLGPGSVTHLYGMVFGEALDVPVTPVAYNNTPSSLIDLIGGQAEMANATPVGVIEYQRSGDLNILAITTAERDPNFPDIPTVGELGFPELQATYWNGLLAPAGTPADVIETLANAAIAAVSTEEFQTVLNNSGQYLRAGGPEALAAQIETDREVWGRIITENNIVLTD